MNSKIAEFFTFNTQNNNQDWQTVIKNQPCAFLNKKCIKNRKSEADIAIGTCTVNYGKEERNVIICPHRLLEKRKIFLDCIHLLTLHEPGNELHIVSEIGIHGGNIDYFLVSVRENKVKDFIGIELQTLDTTGTVWPERQRFLASKNIDVNIKDISSDKTFGMNWKMTAKTILVQLHHKILTFESLNKHLVLVVQDCLLDYMKKEFSFAHISQNAKIGDSMHFHSYKLSNNEEKNLSISLFERFSTDSEGIAKCLGLQALANVELEVILKKLEQKISKSMLLSL
jgi:Restriction endonuclease NotI